MDDQEHGVACSSYGVPPLFAIDDAVLDEQVMGIVQNQCAELKCNAVVLFLVGSGSFPGPIQIASLYILYSGLGWILRRKKRICPRTMSQKIIRETNRPRVPHPARSTAYFAGAAPAFTLAFSAAHFAITPAYAVCCWLHA